MTDNPSERELMAMPMTDFEGFIPSIPVPDLGEPGIEKLLDDYRDEVYSAISTARIVAARAAVVGYVEELRKERDRLRVCYSVCPNCDVSWTGGEVEQWYKTMEAELSRLQASQLSPEEADDVLDAWDAGLFKGSLRGSAIAKLRRISGNAPLKPDEFDLIDDEQAQP